MTDAGVAPGTDAASPGTDAAGPPPDPPGGCRCAVIAGSATTLDGGPVMLLALAALTAASRGRRRR
jgi:hypothetical protein